MGQTVSALTLLDHLDDAATSNVDVKKLKPPEPVPKTPDTNPISRSNSIRSLSQISNTSNTSAVSTVSMSDKFVSYDNTVISIPSCCSTSPLGTICTLNNTAAAIHDMSWKLCIEPIDSDISADYNENENEHICIVFGICGANLLERGYKHRYYGYGYCVTYGGDNVKFQSFAAAFKKKDDIFIKYDQYKGEIIFVQNGEAKKRKIRVDPHINNVITIKCYDNAYYVQIVN